MICVIPARGGSKRIPRKNIVDFLGAPLISYSVRAALDSGAFERVIVSSDDDEILGVAADFGARTLKRPDEISGDFATTADVINHASSVSNLNDEDGVCCLYATAPLITGEILRDAASKFDPARHAFYFSACEFEYPIWRGFGADGAMFFPEFYASRSQDLKRAFHDAGAFYFGSVKSWRESPIFSEKSAFYELPRRLVCDIDTPEDLEFAKVLYEINYGKNAVSRR